MKKKLSPAVALVVILLAVGIAGFVLWYATRDRRLPEHFSPEQLQRMENAQIPVVPHKRKSADATAGKPQENAASKVKTSPDNK